MRRRSAAGPVGVPLALLLAAGACGEREPRVEAAADTIPAGAVATAFQAGGEPKPPVAVLDLAGLEELWSAQRYHEALPALIEYRRTAPYGKNEVVDYMIATSACRVAGEEELGRRMLAWVEAHYALNEESRAMVRAELERCPPATRLVPVSLTVAGVGPAATTGVRGKMFYMLGRGEDIPLANEPVEVHRVIPAEELAARLHPPEHAAVAAQEAAERAGAGYRAVAEGGFVVVSRTHSEADARGIARALDAYLAFFADAFAIPRPPHLVTAYLVPDGAEMRRLAREVHGIGISQMSIGYSFRDDLGMVGIIPGTVHGTLAHELFHLVVRRDFGDVPPWLDEGMAALYEVARVRDDGTVIGLPNWRGPVLHEVWGLRPSIDELVSADWQAFEARGAGSEPVVQAANHATARYFVLFLQDRGLLPGVYRAFRERGAAAAGGSAPPTPRETLEAAVGGTAEEIDTDFAAWFDTIRH